MDKKQKIIELRKKGVTLKEIARQYNTSPQSIQQKIGSTKNLTPNRKEIRKCECGKEFEVYKKSKQKSCGRRCENRKIFKCQHCHEKDGLQVNSVQCGKKYYLCRQCNTKRFKKYRQTEKGKAVIKNVILKSYKKYKEKGIHKVWIQARKLKKQPCEVCGETKVHAHHDDYSKPLEVHWLCPLHHKEIHKLKIRDKVLV